MKAEDLTGKIFGRLKVIKRSNNDYVTPSTGKHTPKWICICTCGNMIEVAAPSLKCGNTKSCGCLQSERSAQAHTKHGYRYERLYKVWLNMKNRCVNKNYAEFNSYGGRGIRVCDEWKEYVPFREWAISQGYDESAPRGEQTIDRIDLNGNYSPDNCRLANMFVQANNKQNTIYLDYEGDRYTISDLSSKTGVPYDHIYYKYVTCGINPDEIIHNYRGKNIHTRRT